MKLIDVIKVIAHENYNIRLQESNFFNETREIYRFDTDYTQKAEILHSYLDYTVVGIDENWNITIKSAPII